MSPPISLEQLQSICMTSQGRGRCAIFLPHLQAFAPRYGINTSQRMAAFLAQVMHESAEFRYVRELGSHAYLDKYDTGPLAKKLGNSPEDDDDGQMYRGRGLVQITGLANYTRCGKALGLDLIKKPELLEQPEYAVQSACWFWWINGLNALADADDFRAITRRINGGYNGYAERVVYWERASRALLLP
jgi:putative chitinase